MSSSDAAGDDEVVHDFAPLIVVYRSGRLERPLATPPVPPGTDAATGVVSRDVRLSASSFVRLYLPPPCAAAAGGGGGGERLPVVVYFHGGGFVIGSAASPAYHRCLNDLAAACPAVAVSVDYRLAPEHPLPAAYEDSAAALSWVLSAAEPWLAAHGDLSRVFLAGDSAGGNICHHLAMHHDLASRRLKGIVLIHPWFWGREPIGGEEAAAGEQKGLWEFVCPDAADGADDPRMNPTAAGAPGLENLACEKVMVCVAEGDTLRWRGRAYAEAAARARGGEASAVAELLESEGVGHVFYLFEPAHEKADELLRRIAAFISAK
uniref:Alpha/beta hydrolase fold-3 domain-containing protein n=1 Tax=Oryza punctata TaxID=4537 RepID=A0A0E0KR87_ORYPU